MSLGYLTPAEFAFHSRDIPGMNDPMKPRELTLPLNLIRGDFQFVPLSLSLDNLSIHLKWSLRINFVLPYLYTLMKG
jgi:hypothetical protein